MLHSHDLHFISQRMHQALLEARLQQDEGGEQTHFGLVMPAPVADEADEAEFERQMEAQQMVTVHERIGSPAVIPPDDLAEAEIPAALDTLIDCFVAHNICIDFFGEYSPLEMYRAIVEDLLDQEIVQLTAPGWVSHIVHTPPRFQVKQHVTLFVHSVLGKDGEMLLGEELSATSQRRMMQKERLLWILDPLDGTSNLVAGLPFYAVSLALREAGAITHGWVYDPNRDELFMAQAGCGAWLDGRALVLDDCPGQLSDCVALIDLKRLPASLRCNLIDRAPYHSMRSLGSVALEWCWLAAGRSSIYLHGGQRLWDYAAGRLVFAEAGGRYAAGLNLRQLGDDGAGLQPLLAMAACSGSLFAQWKDCLLDCQK